MRVNDLLDSKGREVLTVGPATTFGACVRELAEHRVGALVVSRTGSDVAGLVSERDVVEGLAREGPAFLDHTVDHLAGAGLYCCTPDDSVEHLMAVMTTERVRHLPVLTDGRLVGIVSIGDVVKQRLSELEQERRHLQDYITTGR